MNRYFTIILSTLLCFPLFFSSCKDELDQRMPSLKKHDTSQNVEYISLDISGKLSEERKNTTRDLKSFTDPGEPTKFDSKGNPFVKIATTTESSPIVDFSPMATPQPVPEYKTPGRKYPLYFVVEVKDKDGTFKGRTNIQTKEIFVYKGKEAGANGIPSIYWRGRWKDIILPKGITKSNIMNDHYKVFISGVLPNQYVNPKDSITLNFNYDYQLQHLEGGKELGNIYGLTQAIAAKYGKSPDKDISHNSEAYYNEKAKKAVFDRLVLPISKAGEWFQIPMPPFYIPQTEVVFTSEEGKLKAPLLPIGSYLAIRPFNKTTHDVIPQPYGVIKTNAFCLTGEFNLSNTSKQQVKSNGKDYFVPYYKDEFYDIPVGSDIGGDQSYLFNYVNYYNIKFKDINKMYENNGGGRFARNYTNKNYCYYLWVMPSRYNNIVITSMDCRVSDDNTTRYSDIYQSSRYIYTNLFADKAYGAPAFAKSDYNTNRNSITYSNYAFNFNIDSDLMFSAAYFACYYTTDWWKNYNGTIVQFKNPTGDIIHLSNYLLARVRECHDGNTCYHPYPWFNIDGRWDMASTTKALLMPLELGQEMWYNGSETDVRNRYPWNSLTQEFNITGFAYNQENPSFVYNYKDDPAFGEPKGVAVPDPYDGTQTTNFSTRHFIKWKNLYTTADNQGIAWKEKHFDLAPNQLAIYTGPYYRTNWDGDKYGIEGNILGIGYSLRNDMTDKAGGKLLFAAAVNAADFYKYDWNNVDWNADQNQEHAGVLQANPGDGFELLKRIDVPVYWEKNGKQGKVFTVYLLDQIGPTRTTKDEVWKDFQDTFAKASGWYHRGCMHRAQQIFPTPTNDDWKTNWEFEFPGDSKTIKYHWFGKE